jgi:hypothetical protein
MHRVRRLAAVAVIDLVGMVYGGARQAPSAPLPAALASGQSPAADGNATASTTPSALALRSGEATDVGGAAMFHRRRARQVRRQRVLADEIMVGATSISSQA